MSERPFRVYYDGVSGTWFLYGRQQKMHLAFADSPGQLIDYAYKNWPWWL